VSPVTVTSTDAREITGPDLGDDHVRSRLVEAGLTIKAGLYKQGGFPLTAKQFGLEQLRDVRVTATPVHFFAFEPAGARTPDEDSTRGTVRIFTSTMEVEDGTELPEIRTKATAEGV
jgi:hypothetical protein